MPEEAARRLVEKVLRGDERSIAEALGRIEDTRPESLPAQRALLRTLAEHTPPDHGVVGLTGPPGAGKSTLAAALIREWTRSGAAVGMVAVDPSSRRSGGALLGDRVRVQVDPGDRVFIRSMAARERLGGLAPATRAAVVVLRAAFPWTLVETVGVGQSEVDVESVADCVVLVLQPGSGDTLQFMKAGILEIPDLVVVHKWDLGDVAETTRADLESTLRSGSAGDEGRDPEILGVSARTGQGVAELAVAIEKRHDAIRHGGELEVRRERGRTAWALELFRERYGTRGLDRVGGREAAEAIARDAPGTGLDAFSALATRSGLEPDPERGGAYGAGSGSH